MQAIGSSALPAGLPPSQLAKLAKSFQSLKVLSKACVMVMVMGATLKSIATCS